MKRWVVRAGEIFPDGLIAEDVPRPEPGPGEVRIKTFAASINARDLMMVNGSFGEPQRDFIPLSDGSGEIDAIGSGVEGFALGDRVSGLYYSDWIDGPPIPDRGWGLGSSGEDGMLAEWVVLKARRVAAIPTMLKFEEAACLPCAALTAWTALNGDRPYRSPVSKKDKVLITGTGNVALFALLFAKAAGAYVVVTTSTAGKATRARRLGASNTVNYRHDAAWGESASALAGPFDRVVNAAGSGALDQSITALAPGGEITLIGFLDAARSVPNFLELMIKGGAIRGTSVGGALAFADMAAFIDYYRIRPPIAKIFPMSEAKAAYQLARSGQGFGKVVIAMDANQHSPRRQRLWSR